jgi:hypothetical protein
MNLAMDWGGRAGRILRRARWWILGVVIFLVILRLLLPFAVERYVNRQLNRAHDYGGRIGDVHIQLWRGSYRIDNVEIHKRTGGIPVPLFAASHVHLSIEWRELFHGSVVGQVTMDQPRLNFVSGPTAAQTQTGKDEGWNTMLESLFPFKLNRLEIKDGQIHFRNDYSTPKVNISLDQLAVTATNLSNSRSIKSLLPAGITARGTTIGGGGLSLQIQLNPMDKAPTYQLDAQLTNVDLTALNNFLEAYGKFDVARGQFALYTSVASKDANYDGYVKVFFNNLDVFAWDKERQKNVLKIFWEGIVGTVATILKNQPKDSLATRIPISGSYDSHDVGTWTAVATLMRNAFIRALVPKVDDKETVQKVEQKMEEKKKVSEEPPPEKGGEKISKPVG